MNEGSHICHILDEILFKVCTAYSLNVKKNVLFYMDNMPNDAEDCGGGGR